MNFIYKLLILLIILAAGAGFGIYKGMYNFAATSPHNNLTELLIHESVEMSIKQHAKGITAPDLGDEKMINEGFIQYDSMCAMCHGAPGLPDSVLKQGLYPAPPKLYKEHDEWSAEEVFWITKNGIKMTGMPAYGPTHKDEELWAIVAFLQKLPEMSEKNYNDQSDKNKHNTHDHSHGHTADLETGMKELLKEPEEAAEEHHVHIHEDGTEHLH